jgi:uncharacterized damage-inducible protein DinB
MMKQYLIDFFKYNDWANRKLMDAFKQLPDNNEPIKLISHMIAAQDKWLNRITGATDDKAFDWQGQAFPLDQLHDHWAESAGKWISLLEQLEETEITNLITFQRPSDGKKFGASIKDIALQLNYHSIHHRAQINRLFREQGHTAPSTDYIVTVIKEI